MRLLDGKFKIENDQIVKISNGEVIPEDEPVMLFRARDWNALGTIHDYLRRCLKDGCTDYQITGIRERIAAFGSFKDEHAERMKQPGITRGL